MFYTGLMALLAFIVGLIWLITSFVSSKPKRFPLLFLAFASFTFLLSISVVPKSSSTILQSETLSASVSKLSQTANERLATLLHTTRSKKLPYIQSASVSLYENGEVRHIQLNVTEKWHTLSESEKIQYVRFIQSLGRSFVNKGRMPFMQIHSGQEVVARSGAQDPNSFHFFN